MKRYGLREKQDPGYCGREDAVVVKKGMREREREKRGIGDIGDKENVYL